MCLSTLAFILCIWISEGSVEHPRDGYALILYPRRYIPEGTRIDAFCVDLDEIELSKVPGDAVKSYKSIFGKTARVTICQGEILRRSHFVEDNRESDMR